MVLHSDDVEHDFNCEPSLKAKASSLLKMLLRKTKSALICTIVAAFKIRKTDG